MGGPSRTTIYELIKKGILKTVDAPGCPQLINGDFDFALCSAGRRNEKRPSTRTTVLKFHLPLPDPQSSGAAFRGKS